MDLTTLEDYVIRRELKQQTPMLHFQHAQKGATLRATEVKPKLDKFLRDKHSAEIKKEWYLGDTKALNYKMRCFLDDDEYDERRLAVSKAGHFDARAHKAAIDEDEREKVRNQGLARDEINQMYFGNMISDKDSNRRPLTPEAYEKSVEKHYKETVFYSGKIYIEIICFISGLKKLIEENLEEFFTVTNFGTRQSKGFGGFKLVTENNGDALVMLQNKGYKFFYADCRTNDVKELMNYAMTVYAVLKGGLNLTGWDKNRGCYKAPKRYIKGYIQRKFIEDKIPRGRNIGSDKACIKSHLPVNRGAMHEKRKKGEPDYAGYKFVRIILGMADNYKFGHTHLGGVNVYSLGDEGYEVQRFKSPITVKIIDSKIFFIFDTESFKHISGKEFYFLDGEYLSELGSKNTYKKQAEYIREHGFSITVPELTEQTAFDIIDGFTSYFNSKKNALREFGPPHKNAANITLKRGDE